MRNPILGREGFTKLYGYFHKLDPLNKNFSLQIDTFPLIVKVGAIRTKLDLFKLTAL